MFLIEICSSGGILLERDVCSFTDRHRPSCRISATTYQIARCQNAEHCNIRKLYCTYFSV